MLKENNKQILKLDLNNMPYKLELFFKGRKVNEYLIKKNKEKTGVFLNKPDV